MKYILLFFTTIQLITTSSTFAQKLFIGLEGGLINPICTKNDQNRNVNNPFANYTYNRYSRTNSFNLGVNVEYAISKKWSISSKLLFSKEGFKERYGYFSQFTYNNNVYYEYEMETKYSFIRVPILVQYNLINENNCVGLSIIAGPNFGFKTRSSIKVKPQNIAARDENALICGENDENLNDYNIAFQLGLKAHKHISKNSKIFFEVQGLQSLSDITNLDLNLRQDNIINRRIASNVGFQIGL